MPPPALSLSKALSKAVSKALDSFQKAGEERPEGSHRRDLQTLARAMHVHDMRPERDHLHARILFADHAALQARVHGEKFRRLAQNLVVHRLARAHDVALRFGLPSGIAAAVRHFKPRHAEHRGYHSGGGPLAAL